VGPNHSRKRPTRMD